MSSEIAKLLRLSSRGNKEFQNQSIGVTGDPVLFESALTLGNTRKRVFIYNNSDDASGELYWGTSSVTSHNGMVIPKGELTDLPVGNDLAVYFCSLSGETGDLRIMELS